MNTGHNNAAAIAVDIAKAANTSPFPRIVMYFGSKSFSISIPKVLFGRSRTCPLDAITS